jgi:hypothetical protein
MKKIAIVILVLFNYNIYIFAQIDSNKPYFDLMRTADSSYKKRNFELAIRYANQALEFGNLESHLYNIGCYYSLNGGLDSAFYFINLAIENGFRNCSWLTKDNDLVTLRTNPDWESIMRNCIDRSRHSKDTILADYIMTFRGNEKEYRLKIDSLLKDSGIHSKAYDSLWKLIDSIDRRNIQVIDSIVDIHGFPDICMVGESAAYTVFLIVQHADISSHRRYFSLIQNSVEMGCFKKSHLAYLTDRILMNSEFKQLFGTQLSWDESLSNYKLIPVIDSVNIDIRRKLFGLIPLNDYLQRIKQ